MHSSFTDKKSDVMDSEVIMALSGWNRAFDRRNRGKFAADS